MGLKIIRVEFENLKQFENRSFRVDFVATDKVFKDSEMFKISNNIAFQNVIGFIGLNATGKTTSLRLLKTALDIVIRNADLNLIITSTLITDGTVIRTTFYLNGIYYQLESTIAQHNDSGDDKEKFYYKNEVLKSKKISGFCSKAQLTNFDDSRIVDVTYRSNIEFVEAKYLDEAKSIVGPLTKDISTCVLDNIFASYVNAVVLSGRVPSEILDIFDDSIEEFSILKKTSSSESSKWVLKFKNDDFAYSGDSMLDPNLLISTGTISGQRLIRDTVIALKKGGYLFVDEIEAHLNKELVRFVLSLFCSQKTNPNGACLIFSTHYAEILDFDILKRKDNIYITRKRNYLLAVAKFSDEFKRNDFKKSEIILANVLKGTSPKYETMERLRKFICDQVR